MIRVNWRKGLPRLHLLEVITGRRTAQEAAALLSQQLRIPIQPGKVARAAWRYKSRALVHSTSDDLAELLAAMFANISEYERVQMLTRVMAAAIRIDLGRRLQDGGIDTGDLTRLRGQFTSSEPRIRNFLVHLRR